MHDESRGFVPLRPKHIVHPATVRPLKTTRARPLVIAPLARATQPCPKWISTHVQAFLSEHPAWRAPPGWGPPSRMLTSKRGTPPHATEGYRMRGAPPHGAEGHRKMACRNRFRAMTPEAPGAHRMIGAATFATQPHKTVQPRPASQIRELATSHVCGDRKNVGACAILPTRFSASHGLAFLRCQPIEGNVFLGARAVIAARPSTPSCVRSAMQQACESMASLVCLGGPLCPGRILDGTSESSG